MTQETILEIAEQNISRIAKETTFENKHYSSIYWMLQGEKLIACALSDNERLQDESEVIFRTEIPYEKDYLYEGCIEYDDDDNMIVCSDLLESCKEELKGIVNLETGEIVNDYEFQEFLYDEFWQEDQIIYYLEQIKRFLEDRGQ